MNKILKLRVQSEEHTNYYTSVSEETMVVSERIEGDSKQVEQKQQSIFTRTARWCVYLLVGLLPLFFLPFTNAPLAINKTLLAVVLMGVGLIAYGAESIRTRTIIYPKTLLSSAIGVFLLTYIISTVLSRAPWISGWGMLGASDSLLSLCVGCAAFWLASVFFGEEDKIYLARAFFIGWGAALVEGCIVLVNIPLISPFLTRIIGYNTIGSILDWGVFVSLGLVVASAIYVVFDIKKKWRYALIIGMVLGVLALTAVNYWWLWVLLAIAGIITGLRELKNSSVKARVSIPLVLAVIAIFFLAVGNRIPSIARFPTEVRPNVSSTIGAARDVITSMRAPIGVGPALFGDEYAKNRSVTLNNTQLWQLRFDQGFSFWLTLLVTTGVLGVLFFGVIVYSLIRLIRTEHIDQQKSIVADAALFIAAALILYPASFTGVVFFFVSMGFVVGMTQNTKIMLLHAND